MPSFARRHKAAVLCLLLVWSLLASAADFAAGIEVVDLYREGDDQVLQLVIDYRLSPKAREAIAKGVPLSWVLIVKWQRRQWLWMRTVHEVRIPYVIRYEALLNQYSVTNLYDGRQEMFATLNTALAYMESVRTPLWPGRREDLDEDERLAVMVRFDREFLPIPLRPESYFDAQWALSSDWLIWHRQR